MKLDKILLLAQLIEGMEENNIILEKAYNNNNKKRFEESKKVLLDFQNKINIIIKEWL